MPDACPVCGTPVERPENEVMTYCPNGACPARLYWGIVHFASRGAMDIAEQNATFHLVMGMTKWGSLVIAAGVLLLALVGMIACLLPARRATRHRGTRW